MRPIDLIVLVLAIGLTKLLLLAGVVDDQFVDPRRGSGITVRYTERKSRRLGRAPLIDTGKLRHSARGEQGMGKE